VKYSKEFVSTITIIIVASALLSSCISFNKYAKIELLKNQHGMVVFGVSLSKNSMYLLSCEDSPGNLRKILLVGNYMEDGKMQSARILRNPNLSPNGKEVVFIDIFSGFSGYPQYIVKMDIATQKPQQIAGPGEYFLPSYSPKGNKIAFGVYGKTDIEQEKLEIYDLRSNECIQYNYKMIRDPSWSLDGNEIVFSSGRSICILSADCKNMKEIKVDGFIHLNSGKKGKYVTLSSVFPSNIVLWSPKFSPDGKKIAFTYQDGNENGIYIIDRNGNLLKKLNLNTYRTVGIDWSPDGQQIVFAGYKETTYTMLVNIYFPDGLYLVNIESGKIKLLFKDKNISPCNPQWWSFKSNS